MTERYCITPNCNRLSTRRPMCETCRSKQKRSSNPERYVYYNLKSNAKRRGVVFTISFKYFIKWAIENDYFRIRGRGAGSYTIDRIDESKGYEEGNLQMLTKSQNSKKEIARRRAKVSTLSEDYHKQWEPGGQYYTPVPW